MSPTPTNSFQIKVDGIDLEAHAVSDKHPTSIVGFLPEAVSFFEEHSARLTAGYTIPAWKDLSPAERAIEVSIRRKLNRLEAVQFELSTKGNK
jgi:hypothetical protein